MMPVGLRRFLAITDGVMLAYWLASAAMCAGLLRPSTTLMYAGYGTPATDAWNWSFAPLDLAFAGAGLASVRLASRGDGRWRIFALLSLVLTICAGGMAITYWALLGDFNPVWWLPNLLLATLPLIWLPSLLRSAVPGGPTSHNTATQP